MQTAASIAPINAAGVIKYSRVGNKIIIVTPARPAPLEMPIICGSARGFRITACNTAPAMARFIPTKAPTIVRGILIFQIIWLCGSNVGLDKILMICAKLISAEPFVKLKKAPKNASMAKAAMTISRQAVREIPNLSILSKVSA